MKKQTGSVIGHRWGVFTVHRLTLASLLLLAGTAGAATVTWVGSTANWETPGNWSGGSGIPAAGDDVVIDGGGSAQPTLNFDAAGTTPSVTIKSLTIGATIASTLTFQNGDVSTKRLNVTGNVTIGPNGTLTHAAETSTSKALDSETQRLFLNVSGNLTISASGKIDVSGMGYGNGFGGYGPGAGGASGAGGGYGGQGGSSAGGSTYGSVTNPVNSGSSGNSSGGSPGRRGGGTALVRVGGVLTLNGSILADGPIESWGTEAPGSGAGGSVNITAGSLSGNGTISANGGGFTANGGSSGGGALP